MPPPSTFGEKVFIGICGLVSLIYLLNPTAGFVELIPDNVPVIGNLDEFSASLILLHSIRHLFGIDVLDFMQQRVYNIQRRRE